MDYNVSSKVEQRGILAGLLLGDGKRNQNNFFIQNSSKHEEYLLFKKELLEQITGKPVSLRRWSTKKGYDQIRLEPKLIPLTRVLVKKLYQAGTKTITRTFLNFLTPQGIAIWFMDDGSKSFPKKDGKVHALTLKLNTYLSKEQNEIIVAYFAEVWGFKWGLSKAKSLYRLRMGTKEGKRFLAFIRPYIHDSMLYKVQTSLNRTATT
ncbi:LAGLIDADG DNA endonuclease family [Coleofasciculus chthonoplastes PCC 7420]|uniref:LAGLIDADG DNA endonuclease family n=1 Tax=Coleofasciculus chthonoplastes PCC 7420 TaxID=118168 RepID=B4VH67_9CYAN|nr:LAGLIDADG endonuclease [Coleofasciculus chthonoplastes]EDX78351.1 LAGLIDADG DNA endonuclease family [Coleofasciculus chthonoplastes PCC 7420]